MRIVLDTNVLLSGFFTRGLCETVLDLCISSESCTLVLSEYTLGEFERIARVKFAAPAGRVHEALTFLRVHAELVRPLPLPTSVCDDPDDIEVLGTALAAAADVLITGNSSAWLACTTSPF